MAQGKSERHADAVLRRLQADVFPAIGTRAIAAIEAPTIVAMVKAIEERGAHDIAKRALETTGQVFRYAIAHGYVTRNPSADFKPADVLKSVQKTNYARIDAKDLPALLRAVELYQGTPVTRLAIKLLAHTFVRTGELIGACWSEIDFEEKRWNIPAERMKMRTPHIIPLSTQAIEILELLKNLTGDGILLFPGDRSPKKSMSNGTILVALKRMGYQGVMTGHGFHGLASTVANLLLECARKASVGRTGHHLQFRLPANAVAGLAACTALPYEITRRKLWALSKEGLIRIDGVYGKQTVTVLNEAQLNNRQVRRDRYVRKLGGSVPNAFAERRVAIFGLTRQAAHRENPWAAVSPDSLDRSALMCPSLIHDSLPESRLLST